MIDGSELWPSEVSVGEVTYPPGGRLGPRRQHDVQHTIWKGFRPSPILDDARHVGLGEGSRSEALASA